MCDLERPPFGVAILFLKVLLEVFASGRLGGGLAIMQYIVSKCVSRGTGVLLEW